MAFTPKQERQGTAIGAPGHNSADSNEGPMPAPPVGQATAAGVGAMTEGHPMVNVLAEHAVSFEWDSGLAINDVEGGMSG